MIPSSVISQRKYKINGDTIVAFTPNETRKLAIKLLQGEKYEKLYLSNEELIKYKDSIISFQSYNIAIRDSFLVISNNHNSLLTEELNNLNDSYNREKKKKQRNGWIATGSIILNIILIIFAAK